MGNEKSQGLEVVCSFDLFWSSCPCDRGLRSTPGTGVHYDLCVAVSVGCRRALPTPMKEPSLACMSQVIHEIRDVEHEWSLDWI